MRQQLRCVGEATRQDWLGHSCGHLHPSALKSIKKPKMGEISRQTRNSDGNPAIQHTKSGINDTHLSCPEIQDNTSISRKRFGNGFRMSHTAHLLFPRIAGAENSESFISSKSERGEHLSSIHTNPQQRDSGGSAGVISLLLTRHSK